MAIRNFSIGPDKGLRRAALDKVPNLVIIGGPNGAGKSSLLDQLRLRKAEFIEPQTEVLFVGAHRTWRSGALSEVAVLGFQFGYEDLLKMDAIPGFQFGAPGGHHFLGGLTRTGGSADDAQALVKTALVRIHHLQRNILTNAYDAQGGTVAPGTVPDLFTPVRELVATLLPHLEWVGVDSVDNNNIRCLFQSTDGTRFDIDDLSSGEKSAIALFLSFVEREAKELAGQIEAVVGAVTPLTTVILDEPEIHLHPILQLNVLDYMRRLAHENRAQFIVATQSPTMLDAAQESELYLLSPAGLVPDNQLAPLSSSAERLEAVRELTGGTHLLTRCRPVVFIEGEPDEGPTASDQRLFRLMFPSVAHWALVPFSGCSQVVHAVESLRGGAAEVPGSPVFGIVDGDAAERTDLPEAVLTWDVSMIENLFLDADIIWPVIEPYAAVTGINTQSQLSALIADAAHNYREAEIAKRIRSQIQPVTIRLSGTIDNAEQYAADASTLFATRVEAFRAEGGEERIREKVADIVATNQQLNRFDGKAVLREIYGRCHCADAGLSWNVFLTELARHATGSPRANELAQPTIDRIRFFIPAGIEPALAAAQALGVPVPDDLPAIAASARTNWEYANPTGEAYEGLRHGMFDVARGARAQGGLDQAATIDELALQIAVVP